MTTHIVEASEHGLGDLPRHAGVRDTDSPRESLLAVGRLLVPRLEVGLDHDTHDACLSRAELLADIGDDLSRKPSSESSRVNERRRGNGPWAGCCGLLRSWRAMHRP